jgi:hypothetical protein
MASAQELLQLFTNQYKGGVDTHLQIVTSQTAPLTNQRNETDIQRRRMDASALLSGRWGLECSEHQSRPPESSSDGIFQFRQGPFTSGHLAKLSHIGVADGRFDRCEHCFETLGRSHAEPFHLDS